MGDTNGANPKISYDWKDLCLQILHIYVFESELSIFNNYIYVYILIDNMVF